jgi:hypothetical protein
VGPQCQACSCKEDGADDDRGSWQHGEQYTRGRRQSPEDSEVRVMGH